MGLPLAQEIANKHGGCIEIDAEEGRGCRVRLIFPVGPADG
jgi:signal transduction histidine kinase